MKKLIIALAALAMATGACLAQSPGNDGVAFGADKKIVRLPTKRNLGEMSIAVSSNFDAKIIDVTDHVPGSVKLHVGDEVVVARDPRVNYCCGDLSKTLEAVIVKPHNPDNAIPPVLVYSPDGGGAIVRAFIANRTGEAALTIEITCRDASGRTQTQTKTVRVIVH